MKLGQGLRLDRESKHFRAVIALKIALMRVAIFVAPGAIAFHGVSLLDGGECASVLAC